ncbi:MAG: AbrB/MazE/SpoVT family DNA-binding domain-containing protein [Methylococcales bacterium]
MKNIQHIRLSYHWEAGQELIVIDTGDGILLKPKAPFSESKISEVAGCLQYAGTAKTVDEMNDAVAKGLRIGSNFTTRASRDTGSKFDTAS